MQHRWPRERLHEDRRVEQDARIDNGPSTTSVWAAVAASWLAAALLFLYWVRPISPDQYGEPIGYSDWVPVILGGGFLYGLIGSQLVERVSRSWRTVAAWCLVLPVGLAVWGATLQDRHGYWREGVEAFNAYTGHFPRNALGEPYVLDEGSSVTTVCARQVKTQDTNFCVETVTDPDYDIPGEWDVLGSFRFRSGDQGGYAPEDVLFNQFDCTGDLKDECS